MTKLFSESDNVIEAIFKMLKLMSDHFEKMSPAFQMDIKKFHPDMIKQPGKENDLPYYGSNTEVLKKGIEEGVFRNDIDIEITNKCLHEVVRMSHDKDVFPPDNFMNRDVIRNFFISYLRGISTPKGLELISFYENHQNL
jgi:hypothetical protein